jgi:hypothetical protein
MLALQLQQSVHFPIESGLHENCVEHGHDAEREMSAFVLAAGKLYGTSMMAAAAASWVELAEKMDVPAVNGRPLWRQVTIAAASRMAHHQLQSSQT